MVNIPSLGLESGPQWWRLVMSLLHYFYIVTLGHIPNTPFNPISKSFIQNLGQRCLSRTYALGINHNHSPKVPHTKKETEKQTIMG